MNNLLKNNNSNILFSPVYGRFDKYLNMKKEFPNLEKLI